MKQQTIEEAIERQFPIIKELEHSIEYKASIAERKLAFIFGAKWQQEHDNINALNFEIDALKKEIELLKYQKEQDKNKFSAEEVLEHLNLLYSMKNSMVDTFTNDDDYITMKWFEQFKKK